MPRYIYQALKRAAIGVAPAPCAIYAAGASAAIGGLGKPAGWTTAVVAAQAVRQL